MPVACHGLPTARPTPIPEEWIDDDPVGGRSHGKVRGELRGDDGVLSEIDVRASRVTPNTDVTDVYARPDIFVRLSRTGDAVLRDG